MTVEKERNLWEQGDNLRQVPENHGRAVIKKTASWLVIHIRPEIHCLKFRHVFQAG